MVASFFGRFGLPWLAAVPGKRNGRLKGEAEALEQVAIEKECTDILNEIEKARQAAQ